MIRVEKWRWGWVLVKEADEYSKPYYYGYFQRDQDEQPEWWVMDYIGDGIHFYEDEQPVMFKTKRRAEAVILAMTI